MNWKRTHNCGELRRQHQGQKVVLNGWIDRRRDHGSLIFFDLRDRYGITQIRIDPDSACYEEAKQIRNEFVIAIEGIVEVRPEGMINPKILTGEIELRATELIILNTSKTPPFLISGDQTVSEDLRLKYRYLDLRRPEMQRNLLIRHKTYQVVRNYFVNKQFIEIETPFLMKSTPEGARDYLVPSRIWHGRFYALPQSPQQYKQLLMVAGFDRYFQIVRCFRDEDLRADRQPEFTQIDVEMSFIDEEDIFEVVEGLMAEIFREVKGVSISLPLPRLPYEVAMSRYGTDKPDLRFGLEIEDITKLAAGSEFNIFKQAAQTQGMVGAICVPQCARYSRKQIDELNDFAKQRGAAGVIAIKIKENDWDSSLNRFFSPALRQEISAVMGARSEDLLLLIADKRDVVLSTLGDLRCQLAQKENLIAEEKLGLAWIVDFPLFEYSTEEGRYVARHHPFTAPKVGQEDLLLSDPAKVQARAYDLILKGMEVAGGSIRIHQAPMQEKMFKALGIEEKEAKEKFGFLIEALSYGAPPHGGIAFGFDRLVMILAECNSIREVIAFPKTASAMSLMDESPSFVSEQQLEELGLIIIRKE